MANYPSQMMNMAMNENTMSLADCINQTTTVMGAIKAWFDDNKVTYTACDLIDAAELVNEMCESCD